MLLLIILLFIHFSFSPSKFSVTYIYFLASMRDFVYTLRVAKYIERQKTKLRFLVFFSISHSNVIHREICIKQFIFLFSGTERHTKLKLGPHMDSRLMYHVYLNQAAGVYLFLYFFNFLSFKFQNIIFLSHFSVRPTKLKLDTHMGKRLICCVHQIQAARKYLFLYFSSFFCLSLQLVKIKNLHLQNCFNLPLMVTARGM